MDKKSHLVECPLMNAIHIPLPFLPTQWDATYTAHQQPIWFQSTTDKPLLCGGTHEEKILGCSSYEGGKTSAKKETTISPDLKIVDAKTS